MHKPPLAKASALAVSDGDRIQVLVSGGTWMRGCAQVDDAGLWVRLDSGRRWVLSNARLIRVVQSVPLPPLDDALDGELTRAKEFLEPLKEGDRIRVVLAGKPLEHLTGALGTVESEPMFGLVSVMVDGLRSVSFLREALELVESGMDMGNPISIPDGNGMDEQKSPDSEAIASPKTPEPVETSCPPSRIEEEITIGTLVKHNRYWPNHIGVVREIRDSVALLWVRDGVPLYPCSVGSLSVVE